MRYLTLFMTLFISFLPNSDNCREGFCKTETVPSLNHDDRFQVRSTRAPRIPCHRLPWLRLSLFSPWARGAFPGYMLGITSGRVRCARISARTPFRCCPPDPACRRKSTTSRAIESLAGSRSRRHAETTELRGIQGSGGTAGHG